MICWFDTDVPAVLLFPAQPLKDAEMGKPATTQEQSTASDLIIQVHSFSSQIPTLYNLSHNLVTSKIIRYFLAPIIPDFSFSVGGHGGKQERLPSSLGHFSPPLLFLRGAVPTSALGQSSFDHFALIALELPREQQASCSDSGWSDPPWLQTGQCRRFAAWSQMPVRHRQCSIGGVTSEEKQ